MTGLLVQAEQAIAALSGDHAGQLALGASTTIAQYVLPRLLGQFRREHPRVTPTLISGNTEHIVEAVAGQKIALGFIEGPARSGEVKTEPFLEDELVLIAATAHEWAERASVTCAEVASVPLLMRERGSGTRHVVEMALERQGREAEFAAHCDGTGFNRSDQVGGGSGFGDMGFVSRWAIGKDLRSRYASFRIVEVEGLRIRRQFLVAFAAGA